MSCRQLSPPIAVAFVLLVIVFTPPPASAATSVQAIDVSTDRIDYVNMPGYNQVTATANVTFSGTGSLDPVRFDWFAPGGSFPFQTHIVFPTQVGAGRAEAVDLWTADQEGMGFNVITAINVSQGTPPEVTSPPATLNVFNRSAIAIVTDLVLTTPAVFENATVASARADLSYQGNASLFSGVQFDWYYPGWVLAFSETNTTPQPTSPTTAVARSSWPIDRTGNGFHVNATYLGNGAAANSTGFDVVTPRVKTWMSPGDVTGRVVLDAFSSPWGICTNTSVGAGAELVVQPGTVIRFCRDTGLFVNGTLTVNAFSTSRAYFLGYDLQARAGDWRGITFFPGAPSNSILSNAAIQGVTEAVTVRGASVTITDSTITLATGAAIWLTGSASHITNTAISQADIGVRVDGSTGAVLERNRIQGTRIGVLATDSDLTLSSNDLSLNRNAGLQAVRSPVLIDGGSFRDNGVGVFLSEVPRAAMGRVAISGGNDSLRAVDSRAIIVDESTFTGAMYRSVLLINVTATFVNSSLRAVQYDLVLVASLTTMLNSTYAVLLSPVSSVLTIKNFLHVLVESNLAIRPRVEGAWVNVTSDGIAVSSRKTTAAGWSLWIPLTDRTIYEGSRTQTVENVVAVELAGFDPISSPRPVDMSSSHMERFLVVPVTTTPGLPIGFDAIVLLLLAVVMGTVLLAMPAMRRRKEVSHAPRLRPVPRHVPLERGSSYLLPDEKADRAFQILASEIAHGGKALVIARLYPDEVRKRYGLRDVPVLWLSRGYGKETVNPTNLGALVQEIERFMSGKEDSVVLLDGLEYLLVQNDPQKVVKFIQVLVDSASVHHSKLLVSFDVKSVNEPVRALITRDLQTL